LIVAPLDVTFVRNLYEIRAMLDGLAAAKAAEKNAKRARFEGPSIISLGRDAVASGALGDQIAADMRFHALVNELSDNPLIGETTAPHWPYLRRVMAEVLRDDAQMPKTIWDEHAGILARIRRGVALDGSYARLEASTSAAAKRLRSAWIFMGWY
jgi:DNA-binding GntR family transcriptional regulator